MRFQSFWRPLAAAVLLHVFPVTAAPPVTIDTVLAAADLQADVDVLQRAYEQLHPGLYRYNTPEQMRALFDGLRRDFRRDRTLAQAYLAFSEFAAKVRCGHTYANFYNAPDDIGHALFERPGRVPFQFRWVDRRMVVTHNFSNDPTLVSGTEVLSIDGVDTASILRQLLKIARADGSNEAKRVAYLEVQGADRYEAFDIFLSLYFPQIGTSRQTLLVRAPDGMRKTRRIVVDGLTYAQRLAERNQEEPAKGSAPLWTLRYPQPGLAVLTMPTWALYNTDWDWQAFLKASFDELVARGTPALVIDLRNNEGGNSVGDAILARLISEPLPATAYHHRVRYRRVPDDLLPYLDTWDRSFTDWGDKAVPTEDPRFFELLRWQDERTIRPVGPRYTGKVFVLIGAVNSSATFEFADQVQRTHLATLVGQPTGGNRRGINGGAFFFLRLPRSRIELDLPLIGQFPLAPQPDAGLLPDVNVPVTIADIAAGRDAEMAAVQSLLVP